MESNYGLMELMRSSKQMKSLNETHYEVLSSCCEFKDHFAVKSGIESYGVIYLMALVLNGLAIVTFFNHLLLFFSLLYSLLLFVLYTMLLILKRNSKIDTD